MTPDLQPLVTLNLIAGWSAIAAGVLSGAAMGLFFHEEGWLGGYGSFRRRMIRLGHISFFGIGFLNVLFAVSLAHVPVAASLAAPSSTAFVVAAIAMPLCCGLTAWRKPWRHLFPVPVLATMLGIGLLLAGWAVQ